MEVADLDLVGVWLGEPDVARWFLAGSTTAAEVEDLHRCIAGEEPTEALIVAEHGQPIGWCQWYLCRDYPDHADGVGAEPGDIGIDYAIGDTARWGGGVGTALIAELVSYIRQRHPNAGIIADPEAANIASRRVLEKNFPRLMARAARSGRDDFAASSQGSDVREQTRSMAALAHLIRADDVGNASGDYPAVI